KRSLLTNTKRREYFRQYVFRRCFTGDLTQQPQGIMQWRQNQLLAAPISNARSRQIQLSLRATQQIMMTRVCYNETTVFRASALQCRQTRLGQREQSFTGSC